MPIDIYTNQLNMLYFLGWFENVNSQLLKINMDGMLDAPDDFVPD